MLKRLGLVVVMKQKMIGLREKADFLIAAAQLLEESFDLSGRDEDIMCSVDNKHRHRDFWRGIQTTADQIEKAFEEPDGVSVDLVRSSFKPTSMRLVAGDPFGRIALVALGELGDVDAMRGSDPKKEAKDRLLPPTWFTWNNNDRRRKDKTCGPI